MKLTNDENVFEKTFQVYDDLPQSPIPQRERYSGYSNPPSLDFPGRQLDPFNKDLKLETWHVEARWE